MELLNLTNKENLSELRALADRVILANTPATPSDVGMAIMNLLLMYGEFERRGEQSKTVVLNQWRKSLSLNPMPADVLERAAQEYIDGAKASYCPQPGDIITIGNRIGAYRKAMAKKAADFMEATE